MKKGDQDRRTNYYEVTEAGEEFLRQRREWENQYLSQLQQIDQTQLAQSLPQ